VSNFIAADLFDSTPGNQLMNQQHFYDTHLQQGHPYVNNGFNDYGPTQLYHSLTNDMRPSSQEVAHGIVTRVNVS